MRIVFRKYMVSLLMLLLAASCFTGIENSKKITAKDVAKVEQSKGAVKELESRYNTIQVDTFPDWAVGKSFYVVDSNVKRIFAPSKDFDADTLNLENLRLRYLGYTESSVLDNEPKVNIRFTDGRKEYVYPTGKTLDEMKRLNLLLTVPFLVDEDMISGYNELISGKEFYIRTSLWYNKAGEMIKGRKYVKVRIDSVMSGDKVFPLKVGFTAENGEHAYLFMSTKQSSIQNRLFDNLFSQKDIRLNYPLISDANWNHIINGEVALEMTKDECKLALGLPNNIQERPTYDGLQEYWFYTDGTYLMFFDGLLKQFRR